MHFRLFFVYLCGHICLEASSYLMEAVNSRLALSIFVLNDLFQNIVYFL
nr:MAG TPA: hypothetical protein [Caudoviricetes sp.]